jgi:hypothetical protein
MIISNGLQTINHPGIAFFKRNRSPKTADGCKNIFRNRKTTQQPTLNQTDCDIFCKFPSEQTQQVVSS